MWCPGNKNRVASELLEIMLEHRRPAQHYVEPFVGGANVISRVDGERIGNDNNYYLILLWCALLYLKWVPPEKVPKNFYDEVKANPKGHPPELVGYLGMKHGWFGSYSPEHWQEYRREILSQVPGLRGVHFINRCYTDLYIPDNSLVYCDPPHDLRFDTKQFYAWCRKQASQGHKVFVSGFNAPTDFKSLWSQEIAGDWRQQLFIVDKPVTHTTVKTKKSVVRQPVLKTEKQPAVRRPVRTPVMSV